MTLTSYAEYCLKEGDKLKVYIFGNPNKTPRQLAAMRNCDAKYDTQRGRWFVEMTKDNYKAICKELRGLKMECFTKAI